MSIEDVWFDMLKVLAEKGSDLFISEGATPMIKIHGSMERIGDQKISKSDAMSILKSMMSEEDIAQYQLSKSANFAHSVKCVGRFRVNLFFQRNSMGMVLRSIKSVIPTLDELNLPPIIRKISSEKRGMVIFVGATGSGKSTSLASMIQYRNSEESGHILTIEDPIEYLHTNNKSLVNQIEIGIDAVDYTQALENALRQAPDVILMGEIRTQSTMDYAVAFSETGHLCLSTLHANNANQAIDRIINFFPPERRSQLLMDLSLNLKAIISQRLLPTIDGKRTAAVEILFGSPLVSDKILSGSIHEIKDLMKKGEEYGMQTFDQDILRLYTSGIISKDVAVRNADSATDVSQAIKAFDLQSSSRGDISKKWDIV